MAVTKKTTAKPKTKTPGTDMAQWDEQLAKYAQEAVATEANTGSGLKSFSLKSGVLSFDDEAMPNNEMAVVIVDHVLANIYYEAAYDSDNPAPPTCFALGRDSLELAPHDTVVEAGQAQNDKCEGCPMNQFGSAEKGRGKACANKRRLIMIPAGKITKQGEFELIEDEDHFATVAAAQMMLPVMSSTDYAAYVKLLKSTINRPPFAVVTKVKVVPDTKSQFRVTFEALEELPAELIGAVIKRHEEAKEIIMAPFSLEYEEREEKPKGRGKPATKQPTAKAKGGKATPTKAAAGGRRKY